MNGKMTTNNLRTLKDMQMLRNLEKSLHNKTKHFLENPTSTTASLGKQKGFSVDQEKQGRELWSG